MKYDHFGRFFTRYGWEVHVWNRMLSVWAIKKQSLDSHPATALQLLYLFFNLLYEFFKRGDNYIFSNKNVFKGDK